MPRQPVAPPVLDPDQLAGAAFATSFRGYDQDEVRSYLIGLADELHDLLTAHTALRRRMEELESRDVIQPELDEALVTRMLGEETARVLSAAREAAAEIRAKATDNVARLVREATVQADDVRRVAMDEIARSRSEAAADLAAQRAANEMAGADVRAAAEADAGRLRAEAEATAQRLRDEAATEAAQARAAADAHGAEVQAEAARVRTEAAELLDRRRAEVEAEVDGLVATARSQAEQTLAEASALLEAATAQAKAEREAGRDEGRALMVEAQQARERVLKDLARRRKQARQDLEQLHAGRDRLLETYEVVRRTVDEATGELRRSLPEARAAATDAGVRAGMEPESSLDQIEVEIAATRPMPATPEPAGGRSIVDLTDPADAPAAADDGASAHEGQPEAAPAAQIDVVDLPAIGTADDAEPADLPVADDGPSAGADAGPAPQPVEVDAPVAAIDAPDATPTAGAGAIGEGDPPEPAVAAEAALTTADDDRPDPAGPGGAPSGVVPSAGVEPADAAEGAHPSEDERDHDRRPAVTGRRGAEAVFAELRASRRAAPVAAGPLLVEDRPADEASPPPAPPASDPGPGPRADRDSGPVSDPAPPGGGLLVATADASSPELERRDAAIEAIERALARKVKRVLADEQSEVLDAVRRSRGLPAFESVFATLHDHRRRYATTAQDDLTAAAAAGTAFAGGAVTVPTDVGDVAEGFGRELSALIRPRVERCWEDLGGDEDELNDRIRAIYREWKTTRVAETARHFLLLAFGRAMYDVVPAGTCLQWVVDRKGPACPDAEDNSLAGAVERGEAFPTGDRHPPAHPGCRCLVVPTPR